MHNRENALKEWVKTCLGHSDFEICLLAGDASFRRYFRITLTRETQSLIAMDAPPEKESLAEFIKVQQALLAQKIPCPLIHAEDKALGFLLLDDLGDTLLLSVLNSSNVKPYYQQALDMVQSMQTIPSEDYPAFDKAHMLKEMQLFQDWLIKAYLQLDLTPAESRLIEDTQHWLAEQLAAQPQVFIHRDYHSRNLMVTQQGLAVIDFQDAMHGPALYDAVSLLKDCYISWTREQVMAYLYDFHCQNKHLSALSFAETTLAFDLCGLQRHLKVLGIFCRLYLRDGKKGYLADLPLVLRYTLDCCESYPKLHPFYEFLKQRIVLP